MKQLLDGMEANIQEEIRIQHGIQELLDAQLDVLLAGGHEKLPAILEAAEAGIQDSQRLEKQRRALIEKIGAELGIAPRHVTLRRIADAIGEQAEALEDKGEELRACLERIRETNRHVSLLLRHSVLFIEDVLRAVLGREERPAATYTNKGSVEATTRVLRAQG